MSDYNQWVRMVNELPFGGRVAETFTWGAVIDDEDSTPEAVQDAEKRLEYLESLIYQG